MYFVSCPKQGLEREAVVLHRVGFLDNFWPKQGQDFKPLVAPLYPNMSQVPPWVKPSGSNWFSNLHLRTIIVSFQYYEQFKPLGLNMIMPSISIHKIISADIILVPIRPVTLHSQYNPSHVFVFCKEGSYISLAFQWCSRRAV